MVLVFALPPHPAEGPRVLPFLAPTEPTGRAVWSVPVVPAPAPVVPQPVDQRQHWLAYDPSSRSQYPVD